MKIYNYDRETGEYLGSGFADPNPVREDAWLVPANATNEAPPTVATGQAAVFENGAWVVKNDLRGAKWWEADGTAHVIEAIGEDIPANGLSVEPPPPPPTDDERFLTPVQFEYMLANAGFDDVWGALEVAAKPADRAQFAMLKAERVRPKFQLARTLQIVATFRDTAAQLVPGFDLSEAAIRAAWDQAETYGG